MKLKQGKYILLVPPGVEVKVLTAPVLESEGEAFLIPEPEPIFKVSTEANMYTVADAVRKAEERRLYGDGYFGSMYGYPVYDNQPPQNRPDIKPKRQER